MKKWFHIARMFVAEAVDRYFSVMERVPFIRFPYDSDHRWLSLLFFVWVIFGSVCLIFSLLF